MTYMATRYTMRLWWLGLQDDVLAWVSGAAIARQKIIIKRMYEFQGRVPSEKAAKALLP
jgi:hypothetical protein